MGGQAGSQLATGGARELCLSLRAIWFELAELDGYALGKMPSAYRPVSIQDEGWFHDLIRGFEGQVGGFRSGGR